MRPSPSLSRPPLCSCVQCKVPGKLGFTCIKCDGPRQDVCQECNDWDGLRDKPMGA